MEARRTAAFAPKSRALTLYGGAPPRCFWCERGTTAFTGLVSLNRLLVRDPLLVLDRRVDGRASRTAHNKSRYDWMIVCGERSAAPRQTRRLLGGLDSVTVAMGTVAMRTPPPLSSRGGGPSLARAACAERAPRVKNASPAKVKGRRLSPSLPPSKGGRKGEGEGGGWLFP